MEDTGLHGSYPRREASPLRMYSPSLQPLLQMLLSALADMDFDYECEREKLQKSSLAAAMKTQRLERLRARHHERRTPYIQQLAVLQKRISDLTTG
jgi:hypothetical protein